MLAAQKTHVAAPFMIKQCPLKSSSFSADISFLMARPLQARPFWKKGIWMNRIQIRHF